MPKDNATTKPWERQPKESPQAFEAFSTYLGMGAEQSYAKVSQKLGKSKTIIDRWGRTWQWRERCRAYENELARQAQEQAAREVKEMQKRQTKIAMLMQKKAVEALEKIDPAKLDESAIVRLITEGAKLERSNRLDEAGIAPAPIFGAPARPGQQTASESGLDWSKLSTADLEKLARLGGDGSE